MTSSTVAPWKTSTNYNDDCFMCSDVFTQENPPVELSCCFKRVHEICITANIFTVNSDKCPLCNKVIVQLTDSQVRDKQNQKKVTEERESIKAALDVQLEVLMERAFANIETPAPTSRDFIARFFKAMQDARIDQESKFNLWARWVEISTPARSAGAILAFLNANQDYIQECFRSPLIEPSAAAVAPAAALPPQPAEALPQPAPAVPQPQRFNQQVVPQPAAQPFNISTCAGVVAVAILISSVVYSTLLEKVIFTTKLT